MRSRQDPPKVTARSAHRRQAPTAGAAETAAASSPAAAGADTGPAAVAISQLLREASGQLAAGSDSPRLDAELLLSRLLGKPRSFLYAWPDHRPTEQLAERFRADVGARAAGQPVAYTLGVKEFFGLELAVNPSVLIPRQETELLVEEALARIPEAAALEVADLGTGSGAIAIAVARNRPRARLLATDASAAALAVARANAREQAVAVRFARMHWCRGLADASLDLLLANPPYIAEDDPHLPALAAEPRQALVSGADGMTAIAEIIAEAPRVLRPGGWLLLEHGWNQAAAVAAAMQAAGLVERTCCEDLGGQPRLSLARRQPA